MGVDSFVAVIVNQGQPPESILGTYTHPSRTRSRDRRGEGLRLSRFGGSAGQVHAPAEYALRKRAPGCDRGKPAHRVVHRGVVTPRAVRGQPSTAATLSAARARSGRDRHSSASHGIQDNKDVTRRLRTKTSRDDVTPHDGTPRMNDHGVRVCPRSQPGARLRRAYSAGA